MEKTNSSATDTHIEKLNETFEKAGASDSKEAENGHSNHQETVAEPENVEKGTTYDVTLQKELDQIETDISSLSQNFKKRRLSKTELDFLESELHMDLDSVTDADFDMHLQRLIADNENTKEKKKEEPKVPKRVEEGEQPKKKTKSEVSIVSTTTDSYKGISIPANSELFRENETNSVLQAYRDLLNDSNRIPSKQANHINAQLSALPLLLTAPDYLSFNVQMLVNTLPVLDNLATQILRIIAKGPYQKIMELVSNRESYTGIAFGNLVELFETTKRIYNSEESPFFTVENITFGMWKFGSAPPNFLKGREDTIEGTLRKVNLATFLLATLGLIDLGFFFLNEAFLDVFCPPQNLDPTESLSFIEDRNIMDELSRDARFEARSTKHQKSQTKFLKAQAILYLELKTQAYISAIELGDRSKEDIIHDLFPENMDEILLRRKDPFYESTGGKIERNSTLFTPAELDFLTRCDYRKQTLLKLNTDSSLMEKYEWIKFLNDLLEYVSKNVGFLIWGPKGKMTSELEKLNRLRQASQLEVDNTELEKVMKNHRESDASSGVDSENSKTSNRNNKNSGSAENSQDDLKIVRHIGGEIDYTAGISKADLEQIRPKSKPSKKPKQNRPSTFRRVWTAQEEDALQEGLKLKGTRWTEILELFGPGGQINEALKNRSSLQLKDKARNWKLYYIKNGLPLPPYLENTTGDIDKGKKLNKKQSNAIDLQSSDKSKQMTDVDHVQENFTESVYNKMLESLLPNENEQNDDDDVKVDDTAAVVESELKDLVAEAFK
ncbi:hypothetical protein CANINC_004114 [Pichia inconspicua]|uniref:Uncharacterized protein n=1 Tax=Pichia inconspicua TaxID=52247 RepID=A0A4T0WWY5_9ASCO|nr:hypothetical protein CANINC_004114 [[Candida] inconspicua]